MAITPKLVGGPHFSSVRKAREALKAHAEEIYNNYRTLAAQAAAAGDWDTAEKINRFLIEHMPAEDGERMIDGGIDKPTPQVTGGYSGPTVHIGIALGGIKTPELPAAKDVTPVTVEELPIIDVKPLEPNE